MPRDGNYGPAGTTPAGRYSRTCPGCENTFRTDEARQRYCSNACKRQVQNRRYYQRHGDRVRADALERYRTGKTE